MVGLLLLALGLQTTEVSWARVAELFSSNETVRDDALAALDGGSITFRLSGSPGERVRFTFELTP